MMQVLAEQSVKRSTTRLQAALADMIVLVLLLIGAAVHAGNSNDRQFEHYSIEQGLSQSVVNAIAQDAQGFIWLATQDGLNRFDGYQFQVLRTQSDNPHTIPDNNILALLSDSRGNLWIGTARGLAVRESDGQIVRIEMGDAGQELSRADYVLTLAEDHQGNIWIGTALGLWRADIIDQKVIPVAAGASLALLRAPQVRSLFVTDAQQLLVGTSEGLQQLDVKTLKWREWSALNGYSINAMLNHQEGGYWLATDNGLLAYDPITERIEAQAASVAQCHAGTNLSGLIQSIAYAPDGALWIGTPTGLVIREKNADNCALYLRHPREQGGLSAHDVLSLFVDRSDVMWIGTYTGGVNKWYTHAGEFKHYFIDSNDKNTASAQVSSAIMTTLRDRHGNLWIGTSESGIYALSAESDTVRAVALEQRSLSETGTGINALVEDRQGDIWAATSAQGLQHWSAARDSFVRVLTDSELPSGYISTLYEDRTGSIWVGLNNGLLQLQRALPKEQMQKINSAENPIPIKSIALDQTTQFVAGNKLKAPKKLAEPVWHVRDWSDSVPMAYRNLDPDINSITQDWQGNLWMAGGAGLLRFDLANWDMQVFQFNAQDRESISSNDVNSILWSPEGELWVGTSDGLNRVISDEGRYRFERYTAANGLPAVSINAILPGDNGELWLGTNKGIVRFDAVKKTFLVFGSAHGLLSEEFNTRAQFVGGDGERLFGSISGVVSFFPARLGWPSAPVRPELAAWRKFETTQAIPQNVAQNTPQSTQKLVINSDDRVLSFDFALPDYAAVTANRLRYRVRGVADNWIALEGSRTVVVGGLSPGQYTLEVAGSTALGLSSKEPYRLALSIHSPFWTLHRRYLLALVVLASAFFFSWRYWVSAKKRLLRLWRKENEKMLALKKKLQTTQVQSDSEKVRLQMQVALREKEAHDLAVQLDQSTYIDALTGHGNWLALQSHLNSLSQKNTAQQTEGDTVHSALAIYLLDIDDMHRLNERYGWSVGDKLLVQVSDTLQRSVRPGSRLFRLHADTFALVCAVSSLAQAIDIAEFLRSAVLQKPFSVGARKRADMSCSIGFSVWPFLPGAAEVWTPEQILLMAQQALKLVQNNTRNAWLCLLPTALCDTSHLRSVDAESLRDMVKQGLLDVRSSVPVVATLEWFASQLDK